MRGLIRWFSLQVQRNSSCEREQLLPPYCAQTLSESRRAFWAFWFGQGISYFGDQLLPFAVTWWVVTHTQNGLSVSLPPFLFAATGMLISPFAGMLVDASGHKALMIRIAISYAFVVSITGVAILTNNMSLPLLYCAVLVIALLDQPYLLLQPVLLRDIVQREHLVQANGKLEAIRAFVGIASPAFAGYVASRSISLLFFLDAGTFVILVLSLFTIKTREESPRQITQAARSASILRRFQDALTFLVQKPRLLKITLLTTAANFALAPIGFLIPLAMKRDFGFGAAEAGLASSLFAVGVLAGSFLASLIKSHHHLEFLTSLSVILLGIGNTIFGVAPTLPLALVGSFIAGAATIATTIFARTLYQITTPAYLLGRILSVRQSVTAGMRPPGILVGGIIANLIGAKASIAALGMVMICLGLVSLWWTPYVGAHDETE